MGRTFRPSSHHIELLMIFELIKRKTCQLSTFSKAIEVRFVRCAQICMPRTHVSHFSHWRATAVKCAWKYLHWIVLRHKINSLVYPWRRKMRFWTFFAVPTLDDTHFHALENIKSTCFVIIIFPQSQGNKGEGAIRALENHRVINIINRVWCKIYEHLLKAFYQFPGGQDAFLRNWVSSEFIKLTRK